MPEQSQRRQSVIGGMESGLLSAATSVIDKFNTVKKKS